MSDDVDLGRSRLRENAVDQLYEVLPATVETHERWHVGDEDLVPIRFERALDLLKTSNRRAHKKAVFENDGKACGSARELGRLREVIRFMSLVEAVSVGAQALAAPRRRGEEGKERTTKHDGTKGRGQKTKKTKKTP